MPLKYLFTATFADGSTIVQRPDDSSTLEPGKRSAFYDVRKRAEQTKLALFELKAVDGGEQFSVDLATGRFGHNGADFFVSDGMDPNEPQNLAGADRQIVFWRRHTHNVEIGDHSPRELDHGVRYDLGWQANVAGKNVQRIIHVT